MNRLYIFLTVIFLSIQLPIFSCQNQCVTWEKLTKESQRMLSNIFDQKEFNNLEIAIPTDNKGYLICKENVAQFVVHLSPMNDSSLGQQYNVWPISRNIIIKGDKIVDRY